MNPITEKILNIFSENKIPFLLGQRSSGKRELVLELRQKLISDGKISAEQFFIFNLDDIFIQLDIAEDFRFVQNQIESRFHSSLAKLGKPVFIIFEQIQNSPGIFSEIVKLKKSNPGQIRILLTSSTDLHADKLFEKHLQPVTETIRVFAGGLNELIDRRIVPLNGGSTLQAIFCEDLSRDLFCKLADSVAVHKADIKNFQREYLLFGALPGIFDTDSLEKRWAMLEDHLRLLFDRDLLRVFQITDLQKFRQILTVLSIHNGNILNLLNMCDDFGINRNTMRKYAGIMRDTFLIDFVPSYNKEIKKPTMKTPKLYFLNPGLVNFLNHVHDYRTLEQSKNFERLLDSMLYLNLQITMQRCEQPHTLFFLKDYQDHELDFIIDNGKELIPIGITFDNAQRKNKIKTFKYYVRYCSQISNGVIFGDFEDIDCLEMRDTRLYLLPIWMLW